VVRRDGCFTNAQGCHNFNEQLTEPIIKHIAAPWEKVFSRRLGLVLSGLSNNAGVLLTTFHNDVERRATKNGASIAAFQMLKQQLPIYKETLKDASSTAKDQITAKQKDINREFVPRITDNMLSVYDTCVNESGSGSYNRMRGHMDRHVETTKATMYRESTENVKSLIKAMLKEAKTLLEEKADEIFMSIKRDYTGVVVGQDGVDESKVLPRDQRVMRKTVLEITDGAEMFFKRALGLEPELELEPEVESKDEAMDDVGIDAEDGQLQEDALVSSDEPSISVEQSEAAPTASDDFQAASAQEQIAGQVQHPGKPTVDDADVHANDVNTPDSEASPRSNISGPGSPGNSNSDAASPEAQDAAVEGEGDAALRIIAPDAPKANLSFKEDSQAESQYYDSYPAIEDYDKENGAKGLQEISADSPDSFVTIENVD
jgi:hypothetical protein